jgi:integrase
MSQKMYLYRFGRTGYYYIQYYVNGLKRQISTKCKRKGDALIVYRNFQIESLQKRTEQISLKQFNEEYKRFSEGYHTPSTQSAVADAFRWFEKIISNRTLEAITIRDIDQFITHLRIHISLHTARKHYITLAAAFQKAVEWGYVRENLWRRVKRPKPPRVDAPFITLNDVEKVLNNIPHPETRTIVIIAFYTGMRRGEIMAMRWSSVDFERRLITVRNTETFTTKSKKQRTIPMNDECYDALRGQWNNRKDEVMIFTVLPDMVQHQFKRACGEVFGRETKLHFHSLRHSFCSNLIRRGADIRVVQALAGHSSLVVTEKYTHCLGADAINAVHLLSSIRTEKI